MTGLIIIAVTKLLYVYQYPVVGEIKPAIEIVASCQQGQIRATDINWKTLNQGKKYFTVRDKRGDLNTCSYLTK